MPADQQVLSTYGASFKALETSLRQAGCLLIARVREGQLTWDLAVISPVSERIVVRFTAEPSAGHYSALSAMIAAGDFQRAILVHSGEVPPGRSREIETWHIDYIDQLASEFTAEAGG